MGLLKGGGFGAGHHEGVHEHVMHEVRVNLWLLLMGHVDLARPAVLKEEDGEVTPGWVPVPQPLCFHHQQRLWELQGH